MEYLECFRPPGFPCLQEPSADLRKKAAELLSQAQKISGSYCRGTVCEWGNARQKHSMIYIS